MADSNDSLSTETERDLIQRAQAGDETAFGEVVKSHYEGVFRRVAAITRNEHDARDICQDIWVNVWRTLKDFRGEAKFSTWLYPIVTRRAIDHLRRRQRWYQRFLPFLAAPGENEIGASEVDSAPSPQRSAENQELKERISQAIATLPPKLQAVLAMREVEGLSYEQIAENLNCKVGTVMSRLFAARRQLAKQLGPLP